DLVTKYLQDHPDPDKRVAHLVGYPELDPKDVTPAQNLVDASSDLERARYEFSSLRLAEVLKQEPQNAEALLEQGKADLALGLTGKGEQTLAQAAQLGNAQTRAEANQRIAQLRQMEVQRVNLTHPNLGKLQASIASAQASHITTSAQVAERASEGKDQVKAINTRVNSIEYEIPSYLGRVNIRRGTRIEAVVKNLTLMARSINSALQDSGSTIAGVGSLEKNKENGLLKDTADIYNDMLEPMSMRPVPEDSLAVFPSYPQMLDQLAIADGDMLRSVDAARASLTMLDQSLGDLDDFLKHLDNAEPGYNGDYSLSTYESFAGIMDKAMNELNTAATASSQGAQLYNLARARQLSARITMLGLGNSPQRYSTLQYALQHRFGSNGIDYRAMLRQGLTPGDVAAATIVAADIKSTPEAIIAEAKSNSQNVIDVANAHGMHAWPLEIFLGLTYLDYTDDPTKELHRVNGGNGDQQVLTQIGL
ncbi:MAG TPA: hypothetical protein VKB39_03765, partial [Candidatus Baltobacteraceae bacterium]|nr:hypothetical protein [Candidatus Baltobacteraceae bacterium]